MSRQLANVSTFCFFIIVARSIDPKFPDRLVSNQIDPGQRYLFETWPPWFPLAIGYRGASAVSFKRSSGARLYLD